MVKNWNNIHVCMVIVSLRRKQYAFDAVKIQRNAWLLISCGFRRNTDVSPKNTPRRKKMECYYIYIKKDIAIQITLTDVNYKIMHVYYETKHFVPRQRYDRFSQDNEIIFLCEKKNTLNSINFAHSFLNCVKTARHEMLKN